MLYGYSTLHSDFLRFFEVSKDHCVIASSHEKIEQFLLENTLKNMQF